MPLTYELLYLLDHTTVQVQLQLLFVLYYNTVLYRITAQDTYSNPAPPGAGPG